MSRADEFWHAMRDKGTAEIYSMIAAPVAAELFLDYKRSSIPLPKKTPSDDDRRNLSKTIGE